VGRKKSKTDAPKEGSSSKQPSPSNPAPNTPRTRAATAREAAAQAAMAAAAAGAVAEEEAAAVVKRYVLISFHVSSPYYKFNYLTMHPTIQEVALR
jgi:hypothetical protein